jgi:hypothetical protein
MHYDALMRTTLELPEDLHRIASSIARDRGQSLSETVADLLRRALGQGEAVRVEQDATTGLPIVRIGRPVTSEDVRSLDDDE